MTNQPMAGLPQGTTAPLKPAGPNAAGGEAPPARRQIRKLVIYLIVLSAAFCRPLYQLCQYSLHSDFFSYIPLIPAITLYLIHLKKPELPGQARGSFGPGLVFGLAGGALVAAGFVARHSGWRPPAEDFLTWTISSYLLFVVAGCLIFLGRGYMRWIAFPVAFLAFMIPITSGMKDWLEWFFQNTSAVTATAFLTWTGMPVLRNGMELNLPGYTILVAPECSGIHSTMVLLITAFLAGHLFLRSRWRKLVLVLFVIPLAIARNGFRIFVISELCVRVSHEMINSPIHRKGGPLFFALSLIPFFYLLVKLRKSELRGIKAVDTTVKV